MNVCVCAWACKCESRYTCVCCLPCVALPCAELCYVVLCCVVLFCVVLCCMYCDVALRYVVLHCIPTCLVCRTSAISMSRVHGALVVIQSSKVNL